MAANKIIFIGDRAVCCCGNSPEAQGFFPCSPGGSYMEPDAVTWLGFYRCDRCGAVGHPDDIPPL